MLSSCPESMTTYVDVPVTNTVTNYVDVPVTNTVTNTVTNYVDVISPIVTNHSFTVAENVNIGTVIDTVKASDNIAVIYYVITTGDTNYIFSINTNGELRNVMKLNHDVTPSYNFTVQVSDAAGNTSNATITVAVTDVDASPTVTTMGASGVQNNSVTLNGSLSDLGTNSDGSQQVNEYGFIYSTNASGADSLQLGESGVEKIAGASIASTGPYNHVIANLSPGTIHYFRAFAVNDGGTNYGNVSNFSTTYHQTFTLSGAASGTQSNFVHANSTHTYSSPLSHERAYNLTIEAASNVSDNLAIYEGTSTNQLYVKAGPFSVITGGIGGSIPSVTNTFSGIDGGNGRRYLVLPLYTNIHHLVISNSSVSLESYTLTLGEETGTASQPTGRLLTDETSMGFFSNNEPELYWLHMPPNKINFEVALPNIATGNVCIVGRDILYRSIFTESTNAYHNVGLENITAGYHIIRFLNNNSNIDYRGCQYRFRIR